MILKYRNAGQNSRLLAMYAASVVRTGTVRKLANAIRTEISYRRRTVDVRSMPYLLFLEPLYYCNLDCPLCDRQVFPDARRDDAGKIALDLYDRVLDELGPYLFQVQIFGQGEPMMNWALTGEIIRRTRARRIFTMMSTNATLIDAERADGIVRSGLDYLVCAIDGITQGAYAKYRVGGSVDAALAGLRHVAEARRRLGSSLRIEWQYLQHSGNHHETEAARAMAHDFGVRFRVAPICGMEWDATLQDEWQVPGARRIEPGEVVNDFPCYFMWRSLVLNSNGKTARCLVYQNAAQYADLRHMSVREAYNHPSVQTARRLFRGELPAPTDPPLPCDGCGHFQRAHGAPVGDRNSRVRALQLTRQAA